MARTMSDEQERWIRKALSLSPAEHGGWPDVAKELVIELDALRERLAQVEGERVEARAAIVEALRCPGCGGWGFLKHPRPAGSDAALRARTRDAVVAGANWQKSHHGTYEPERQRAFEAIVARLLEPRSDTPEARGMEGEGDAL